MDSVECQGTERRLIDCNYRNADAYDYHSEDAGVRCLVGQSYTCYVATCRCPFYDISLTIAKNIKLLSHCFVFHTVHSQRATAPKVLFVQLEELRIWKEELRSAYKVFGGQWLMIDGVV